MTRSKYYFSVLLLFVLMSTLCGCAGKTVPTDSGRIIIDGGGGIDSAYGDQGVVYPGGDGYQGISLFFDPESGSCVPLCTKVNCSHRGYDPIDNPTPNCDAYYGYVDCDAVIGDYLYYVQTDTEKGGFREKLFCRADVNGKKRKVLHKVENAQTCNFSRYENGYLIFAYYNQYDEDGNQMDTRDPGIYLLNLETETLDHIDMPAAYNGYIGMAAIGSGKLYFFYQYSSESWDDYAYEDFADPEVVARLNKTSKVELWDYDLGSGEKTCLWSVGLDRIKGVTLLDYRYLLMQEMDGKTHLENLDTGAVVEKDAGVFSGKTVHLFDEGAMISGDGEFSVWNFDTGEYRTLCSYEGNIWVNALTERWVYADRFDGNENHLGEFYMPRDRFMSGEWEWKPVPTRDAQTGDETQDAKEPTFDDYVVWAVPKDNRVEPSAETMAEINRKLAADGYRYGLKILSVDADDYLEQVVESGADIVSLGLSYDPTETRSQTALEKGMFLSLDDRLAGSALYDAFPPLMWEEVRYRGGLCLIPSEGSVNRYFALLVNTERFPEGLSDFDGDIFKLGEYLSKEVPLYCDIGLEDAWMLGYVYDRGLLFAEGKEAMNPLEEERFVEWFRTVNRWYHEGWVERDSSKANRCGIALTCPVPGMFGPEWQECYSWKGYSIHRTEGATGILASSERADAAFSMLELFHTDHSYGNLLIYGAEDQGSGNGNNNRANNKLVFGLATGLTRAGENEMYFSTAAEWKQYFEEHVEPSPSLYLEYPQEYRQLVDLKNKYFGIGHANILSSTGEVMAIRDIIACDDFEVALSEYREELKEPMEAVLGKLIQNP